MSTPSTATAIHPHHRTHPGQFGALHNPIYRHVPDKHAPSESNLNATARRVQGLPTAHPSLASVPHRTVDTVAKPEPPSQIPAPSQQPDMASRRQPKPPDWSEFYKNGVPSEIIVIDDDSPVPPQTTANKRTAAQAAQAEARERLPKKRRTGPTASKQQVAYSNADTSAYADSGTGTISTDRTTSLQTTAPTSLGSNGSGGIGTYQEAVAVGQKRKRVTRQTTAADEKKRKDATAHSALDSYYPPPQPPIKSGALHVREYKDVSLLDSSGRLRD